MTRKYGDTTKLNKSQQIFRIYRCSEVEEDDGENDEMPYSLQIWRPTLTSIAPPTVVKFSNISIFRWVLHHSRLFRNRDYQVLLLKDGERYIHCCSLIPASFRFPFMAAQDLQLSSIWTNPEYRGQGLAKWMVRKAMRISRKPGRTFWYITRYNNHASIAVCTKVGYTFVEEQIPKYILGLKIFHSIVMPEENRRR